MIVGNNLLEVGDDEHNGQWQVVVDDAVLQGERLGTCKSDGVGERGESVGEQAGLGGCKRVATVIDCKWIRLVGLKSTGVTERRQGETKDGNGILGIVKWYPRWRRYCFFPERDAGFEQDCLRDIAQFCETKTKERKAIREQADK